MKKTYKTLVNVENKKLCFVKEDLEKIFLYLFWIKIQTTILIIRILGKVEKKIVSYIGVLILWYE